MQESQNYNIEELLDMLEGQQDMIDQIQKENRQLQKQIEETTGATQTAPNEALLSELRTQNDALRRNIEAIRSQYAELQECARITHSEADKVQKEFKGLKHKISRYRTVCLVCVAGMLFFVLSYILRDVTVHDIICFLAGFLDF